MSLFPSPPCPFSLISNQISMHTSQLTMYAHKPTNNVCCTLQTPQWHIECIKSKWNTAHHMKETFPLSININKYIIISKLWAYIPCSGIQALSFIIYVIIHEAIHIRRIWSINKFESTKKWCVIPNIHCRMTWHKNTYNIPYMCISHL